MSIACLEAAEPVAKSVAQRAAERWDSAGHRIPIRQAYDIRDLAALCIVDLDQSPAYTLQEKALRAQALRNLEGVWTDACDRIRVMRGRPLPGSLRPERKPKSSTRKPKPAPVVLPESPDQAQGGA